MNSDNAALAAHLRELNDLLVRERHAITHLRMPQLEEIQRRKTELLRRLRQVDHKVDGEAGMLIDMIRRNNDRNRVLLESGLRLIGRLQDNIFRRLALTYAAHGRSLVIEAGPRLLSRSV